MKELTVRQCRDVRTAARLAALFVRLSRHPPTTMPDRRQRLAAVALAVAPFVEGATAAELAELFIADQAVFLQVTKQVLSTTAKEFTS